MLSLIPGSKSRPANVYLPHWTHGKPAALDVAVISPLQKLTLQNSATIQGYALSLGEDWKRSSHAQDCFDVGVPFIPLLVETIGSWSSDVAQTISSLGRCLGHRFGSDPQDTISHLFQHLSISLWCGNASMWVARSPILAPFIDGFV